MGLLSAVALLAACCESASPPATSASAASAPPASTATVPHGDHNPHHGGVVLMKGDLHYEVVVDASGRAQLFFTDAVREDLPASIASRVSIVIRRPGEPDEPIELHIDDTGESWIGAGRPVADPSKTMARVGFTIADDPYWIDLPLK